MAIVITVALRSSLRSNMGCTRLPYRMPSILWRNLPPHLVLHSRTLRIPYDLKSTCTCGASGNVKEPLVIDKCHVFTVSSLTREDIPQASVVITRAFASSPQYIPIAECQQYCKDMLEYNESEGVMLVGTMQPGPECAETMDVYLPQGRHNRVVATASLSFCTKSRENFLSLDPPENEPYLCNIAVDPSFRRKGLAKYMLMCAEEYCSSHGYHKIYLHVRLGDTAARSLYDSCGYQEIASDR